MPYSRVGVTVIVMDLFSLTSAGVRVVAKKRIVREMSFDRNLNDSYHAFVA